MKMILTEYISVFCACAIYGGLNELNKWLGYSIWIAAIIYTLIRAEDSAQNIASYGWHNLGLLATAVAGIYIGGFVLKEAKGKNKG